ncbi:MAG: rane protein-like protein [Parcubacteria group bacterium]|nr:rane protein-like protein [Parcubacteria group bacterium]
MGFFIILSIWTIGWLAWNLLAPVDMRFDPAPAFVVWLFASNMIQLVLLPLVMVSQNIEAKVADRRAQEDFEVNKKSEREIEVIIAHLENQNDLLLNLAEKIDRT